MNLRKVAGKIGNARRGVFLAALLALQLTACAVPITRPEIGLASIELIGLGLVEQRFRLKLKVVNPNAVDLPLNALSFDLEFNGAPFAQGRMQHAVLIPRQGEALVDIVAVSRLARVLALVREMQTQGRDRVAYRLVGRAELEGVGTLPFAREGDVALPAFAQMAPK